MGVRPSWMVYMSLQRMSAVCGRLGRGMKAAWRLRDGEATAFSKAVLLHGANIAPIGG
jgi:hypothetical protein